MTCLMYSTVVYWLHHTMSLLASTIHWRTGRWREPTPRWECVLDEPVRARGERVKSVRHSPRAHQVVLVQVLELGRVEYRASVSHRRQLKLRTGMRKLDTMGEGGMKDRTWSISSGRVLTAVLSGAGRPGDGGAGEDRGEVDEEGRVGPVSVGSRSTPQPESASQLRSASGSHPRRYCTGTCIKCACRCKVGRGAYDVVYDLHVALALRHLGAV